MSKFVKSIKSETKLKELKIKKNKIKYYCCIRNHIIYENLF